MLLSMMLNEWSLDPGSCDSLGNHQRATADGGDAGAHTAECTMEERVYAGRSRLPKQARCSLLSVSRGGLGELLTARRSRGRVPSYVGCGKRGARAADMRSRSSRAVSVQIVRMHRHHGNARELDDSVLIHSAASNTRCARAPVLHSH
jgi:hypothetical protein